MEPCLLHHRKLMSFPICRKLGRYGKLGRDTVRMGCQRRVFVATVKPRVAITEAPETSKEKTAYNDSWFDRLAIQHLSHSVQVTTGIMSQKEGYESLIEAASTLSINFCAMAQQQLVIEALNTAFPKPILAMIKVVMPPSRIAREFFAIFTTLFFPWLIGRCEVRESEFQGKRERNVVYIPKCRFLESTNCVGMCTNLCKVPSETFIKDSLGMPIHMVPNFEDMSCEMIFGQHPPANDPAMKQPCYQSLCIAKQTHNVNCSN